jgi:hypothetical protein
MLEREKKIVRGQHVGFTVWICFCFLVYNDLRLPLFPKLSSATISRSDPWCLPGSSLVAAVIDNRRRTNEVFICEGRFHSPRPISPSLLYPSQRAPPYTLPAQLHVGGTRKIRITTLTRVRVLNAFKYKVRAQRDCDSLCK